MGVAPDTARQAIRVSLGASSDEAAIDRLVEAWGDLYRRRGHSAAGVQMLPQTAT
jgi:cysteine sulfinate desulfinase/cysteine desulfurase-like protein